MKGALWLSERTVYTQNSQSTCKENSRQTRRHGGAFRGRAPPPQMTSCAPPNENCAPPSEDCAPMKLTGLGLLECKSRPKLVSATGIFVIFVDWRRTTWHFGIKTFFFWRSPVFGRKNRKTVWISDFSRKTPLNFWSSLWSFDPDWDKFLVPPCPSRININKLLVPPQNLFLSPPLPVTLSWRRAWCKATLESY